MLKNFIGITAIIFNKFKYFSMFAVVYYSNKISKEIIANKIEKK